MRLLRPQLNRVCMHAHIRTNNSLFSRIVPYGCDCTVLQFHREDEPSPNLEIWLHVNQQGGFVRRPSVLSPCV